MRTSHERTQHEKLFVDEVCLRFDLLNISYQREVWTPFGYADIVTDDELIEVKYWQSIKDSIGQVICYNSYLKKPKKSILVFSKSIEENINMIWISQISIILEPYNIVIKTKEDL